MFATVALMATAVLVFSRVVRWSTSNFQRDEKSARALLCARSRVALSQFCGDWFVC